MSDKQYPHQQPFNIKGKRSMKKDGKTEKRNSWWMKYRKGASNG